MSDPADIDGDGEFDALDITILEQGKDNGGRKSGSGCCVMLFLLGSTLIAGLGDYPILCNFGSLFGRLHNSLYSRLW